MGKRDPEKTARNKRIDQMSMQLKSMLPIALSQSGFDSDLSFHAIYGGKHAEFIDIKHAVIQTPEHFVALWLRGYMKYLAARGTSQSNYYRNFRILQENEAVWEYIELFLKRTFLRNYDALSRVRPTIEKCSLWIGQNRASYGLLVTPRFRAGNWENDKSEIRHFPKNYWTIGHVLETGLVIPFVNDRIEFADVDEYLTFFEHVLVRNTGSIHEARIAQRYSAFVKSSKEPEKVPLLIPELRYAGLSEDHKHRLDFCIIDPFTMNRVGFELSPWSTHGQLTGTRKLTQIAINSQAKANFEKEMQKLENYFREHDVYVLIFTDQHLSNPDALFKKMTRYLNPVQAAQQLQLTVMEEFLAFKL